MVLRAEAVREGLLRLEEVITGLAELAQGDPRALRGGLRDAWAVERGLQLAAEISFDIGNHILSAHFGISARDYEDILARLGEVGVLDAALHDRLKGLGGFRNVLVHGYLKIDAARVLEALRRAPADFGDFARAVRAWLDRTLV